jgi:hypothetical protein
MKDILDNPYVPSRTIKDRARHATLPGVFPTRKAKTPWVRTRLPPKMNGLIHLETDPRVVKIAPYPPRLRYSVKHDITGRSKEYDVFPDVALLEDDGHVAVSILAGDIAVHARDPSRHGFGGLRVGERG